MRAARPQPGRAGCTRVGSEPAANTCAGRGGGGIPSARQPPSLPGGLGSADTKRKRGAISPSAASWAPAASRGHPSFPPAATDGRRRPASRRCSARAREPGRPRLPPTPAHRRGAAKTGQRQGASSRPRSRPTSGRVGTGGRPARPLPPLTRVLRAPRRLRLARGPRRQQLLCEVAEPFPVPLRPAPLDLRLQLHVRVRALGRHLSAGTDPPRPGPQGVPGGASRARPPGPWIRQVRGGGGGRDAVPEGCGGERRLRHGRHSLTPLA